MTSIWSQELFQETVVIIFIFLFSLSSFLFFLRNKGPKLMGAWASLKSWIFVTPIALFAASLPQPYPIILLAFISIYCAKTFFRMVGIYHRSWFVLTCYLFIAAMAYCIINQWHQMIPLLPMIFLVFVTTIPVLMNSFSHMIQYMALTLLAFMFFGWALMHFGLIFQMDKGIYIVMYLYILAEFNDVALQLSDRFPGRWKPLSKVAPRFTVEGFIVAFIFTTILAWGLRHLLPHHDKIYWIAASITTCTLGRLGVFIMTVLRKDLGIKDSRGPFIIGRNDILTRVDKLIFVGPAFYYTLLILAGQFKL